MRFLLRFGGLGLSLEEAFIGPGSLLNVSEQSFYGHTAMERIGIPKTAFMYLVPACNQLDFFHVKKTL